MISKIKTRSCKVSLLNSDAKIVLFNLLGRCVHVVRSHLYFPRANGRSGRKPGARVTNFALAFTYIRIMRSYIAQWHSGIKSSEL